MSDHAVLDEFRHSVRALSRNKFMDGYLERSRGSGYPFNTLRTLGRNGLLGLCVEEAEGGQGAGLEALGIACEEVSYADTACGYQVFASNVAADLIARHGSDEVRQRWLRAILDGEAVCAIALTEPGSGSDAQALSANATRVADGWCLSGEKTSVTQAADAQVTLVVARESDSNRISVFAVPMDRPGLSGQRFDDPGFRAVGRGSITMDEVVVPDSHRLGSGGEGFAMIMAEFDLTRTLIAFMATGPAQRAIDMTINYIKTRTTFGKSLTRYQGVTFPIAEHLTYLRAIRTLATTVLREREAGRPHTVDAAMLKWWAPQAAVQAIQDCIVLNGHVGWSEEMPLQALMRDVSGLMIGDGTPQIQKLIIARHCIGPEVVDH